MDLRVTEAANGQRLKLKVGQNFVIALPENLSTGYHWTFDQNGGSVCSSLGDSFEPSSHALGAPGVHEWKFRATAPGAGVIEMKLSREWDPKNPTQSLKLLLDVT